MAKRFLKSTETRDELQLPAILSTRCLSAPDATSLHHCLKKQAAKTDILSEVSIQVMCIVEEGVANACI